MRWQVDPEHSDPHCPPTQVVLEAETTNASALRMYQRLGFLRTKRLPKYYMSGSDAFRLKLTF